MDPQQLASFRDETEKIAAEKRSSLLLAGLGSHLLSNAAFRGFTATRAGHAFEAGQFATGLRHAEQAKKLNPVVSNIATYGIGPESLANYELGQHLGSQTAQMGKGKRYRFLKKLRKNVAMTEHIRQAPLGRAVVPAVNRVLDNRTGFMDKLPTVAAGAKTTPAQTMGSLALGGGLASLAPDTVVHMGLNAVRQAVGTSKSGQRFLVNQLKEGVTGQPMNRVVAAGQDFLVSPGSRYARSLGESVQKELVTNPSGAAKAYSSLSGQALGTPLARQHLTADQLGTAKAVLPGVRQAGQVVANDPANAARLLADVRPHIPELRASVRQLPHMLEQARQAPHQVLNQVTAHLSPATTARPALTNMPPQITAPRAIGVMAQ